MTSIRLGSDRSGPGPRTKTLPYAAATLSIVAALIHLVAMPEHFEEWWGYGTFFLVVAVFQGAYGAALLRRWRPWLLYLGVATNLGVVALWLVTRTAGIPFFGPHAGEVEDVGALDLAATSVELALVFVLLAGLWASRPDTVLPAGASRAEARQRERNLIPILVLAVVALFGLALWLWLSGRPPGDSSAEAGFARDMIFHHAQAVEMAEIVRDKTESEEIRTLATDIALTQQAQIGQMQGWLAVWGLPATGTEPAMAWMGHPTDGRMPGMASPEEVAKLSELPPREADVRFLQLLIPHHKAALGMAEAVLEETSRPEVEGLAGAISASQRAEIAVIEEMLRERGEEAPAGERAPGGMDPMPGMEHGGKEGGHD
ncbi:MAG: DUF305 domain-containing protein [Actinomycetota bacterium]|nr:DUF305 domain-containing protein [Actinomycetota bacterium]